MKNFIVLALLLALTACASEKALEKSGKEVREEMALWKMLQYKQSGQSRIIHEDKWYIYTLELEYVGRRGYNVTSIGGLCPIERATYTVVDKDTQQRVRTQELTQVPCAPCHRR